MSSAHARPSLSSVRAPLLLVPVSAEEILASLAGLPAARPVSVAAPLIGAVLIAEIEVVGAPHADERTLRKRWRERRGGGATPLLLVADDPGRAGSVITVGPLDDDGALHSVDASALSSVLARVSPLPRLDAVRELAGELERLDQVGIPGVNVRDLLTTYTLDERLRKDPTRWKAAIDAVHGIGRDADWRAVLNGLGYTLDRRPHRGYLARADGKPVLVVHPKASATEFARLDADGRPAEGALLNDCAADGAPFGALAAGGRLRLFHAHSAVGSASAEYLDLDASVLQPDDRPFLGILAPGYLAEGGFDRLVEEARDFGANLRLRIDETLRQRALPAIARALGHWARDTGLDPANDATREELERAALTLVFRVMFVLYAESARYLPMANRTYRDQASLTALVSEAAAKRDQLGARSTALWGRFAVLVGAMRTGNPAWEVPAYNGALFAADGFDGASTLERFTMTDPDFAEVLLGLGRDADGEIGVDYSTLEIGHLGHIYESLLSLRLSVADAPLSYDARADRYSPASKSDTVDVANGDLLWQTHEGGRKSGGVYYTRSELVRHLVRQAVVPAFEAHLGLVRERAVTDPAGAADALFDFAVLDPACGSAHFLVEVVSELADMVVRFLADTPLPAIGDAIQRLRAKASAATVIDDVAVLRRLVMKRCVFGVDVSPMGAEVAKLSLWLGSFVPGLSLAYLDRNVVVGNSLIGVARPEALMPADGKGISILTGVLDDAIARAATAVRRVAEGDDRTPDEVHESEIADAEAVAATANLARLFDLWTAEPFGVEGARDQVEFYSDDLLKGRLKGATKQIAAAAQSASLEHGFLHWALAFPAVFDRERPGFDAVVGNPPWNEVTVEELGFYGMFEPGIRNLSQDARRKAVAELLERRPDLPERLERARAEAALERRYLAFGEYSSMVGDPDLYKYFCQRYRRLVRPLGMLGVVLPRNAFIGKGSAGFRSWLFEESSCIRIDFLANRGRWAFDKEPKSTDALVAAQQVAPATEHKVAVAGIADSLVAWNSQAAATGVNIGREAFGPDWTVPLVRDDREEDLLAKMLRGSRFPNGASGKWRCFPVAELHETNDRTLWQNERTGWALWKGESFDQYEPRGSEERHCPYSPAVEKKVQKPRPGDGSLVAGELALADRRAAVIDELGRARVAFRDVTNRINSRTVLACLVPPQTLLTNTAPYLAFRPGDDRVRAACLGIMNSLPFDWQARRFVELHVNFFILEGLMVPNLGEDALDVVASAAARLSCPDERFADFAAATGVQVGVVDDDERLRLRVEIDAQVARAWELDATDVDVMFNDFTTDAVSPAYRELLQARLAELG